MRLYFPGWKCEGRSKYPKRKKCCRKKAERRRKLNKKPKKPLAQERTSIKILGKTFMRGDGGDKANTTNFKFTYP